MTLGADLVVLAIDEKQGIIREEDRLGFALAAADLVDLARARRIEASPDQRVHVAETLRTGDAPLDDLLGALSELPGEGGTKAVWVSDWVRERAPGGVARHVSAMIDGGELRGRGVTLSLGAAPTYAALRLADPARRGRLVKRLSAVAGPDADLIESAFGALAHAAAIDIAALGHGKHRVGQNLKRVADRFSDTSRFLPGCPSEFAMGDDDLGPGRRTNPVGVEPWRLAVMLAVQEAILRAEASVLQAKQTESMSQDVKNAAALARAFQRGF